MTYGDRPTCAEIGTVAALEREITRLRTAEQHALSVVRAQQETVEKLRAALEEVIGCADCYSERQTEIARAALAKGE